MDFDLGTDIKVLPDLDDHESVITDADCLLQDILLRLDNPQGLADGTEEGESWGLDLRGQLGRGMTPRSLLELIVLVELEVEKDDRVLRCSCVRSYFVQADQALHLLIDVETLAGPHAFSIRCIADTLSQLQV